jgi:NTE family protein
VTSKLINPKLIASQIRTSNYEKCVFRINDAPDAMDKVIASASIPLYFGPTQIGLEFHVDGGVVDNNPIDVLIDAGCEVILTVPLDHGFDPSIYRHKNVMIINLTDLSVFQKVSILNAYDIIRFDQTHINEKANYGYFVAKDVISKLRDLNLLKKGLILNYNENFVKPTRYIYFDVPLETYEKVQKLKEERVIKRKEQKKRQKYQKKLNKKMKEDNQ